ncbi:hypothetical protein D3C77_350690 [compost metagenome]
MRGRLVIRNIEGSVHDEFGVRRIALSDHLIKILEINIVARQLVHRRGHFLPVDLEIDQEVLEGLHLNDDNVLALSGSEMDRLGCLGDAFDLVYFRLRDFFLVGEFGFLAFENGIRLIIENSHLLRLLDFVHRGSVRPNIENT